MPENGGPPTGFIQSVKADIEARGLIPKGARILAAVSGGADSTALLLALLDLAPESGWSVTAAHYNHRMRPGADEDEEFVSGLCHRLGIPLASGRSETLGPGSSEEAARDERLAFLRASAASSGAGFIATGHTADDRVESVLINLLRGAGVDGLQGISWAGGEIVRPLLGRRAGEVRAFLQERGQPWRTDETNASAVYARNRVRHRLLPMIESEMSPDARAAILRLAETAGEDARYLNGLAREALSGLIVSQSDRLVRVSAAALTNTPRAIARRAVRAVLADLLGGPRDVTFDLVERVLEAAREPAAAFDAGLNIRVRSDHSSVWLALPAEDTQPYNRDLVAGVNELPEARCSFELGQCAAEDALHVLRLGPPDGRLHVRSWRPGDRMRPRGLGGSRKLQDIFTDAKVPREDRRKFPVVCVNDEIIWLPGLAVGEQVTPGPLILSVRPLSGVQGIGAITA